MEKFILGLFGKGPTMFPSSSTAEEVTAGIDASGLTVIVTGASSGIGSETARVLALRGAHVIMAVRNLSNGEKVKQEILKENSTANVDIMELDLASKASVRKFAADYNSRNLPLNVLINNAGVMAPPFMLSKDGIELQFATNYLGHFLLTDLLLDTMKRTAATSNVEGRIVNVSSELHRVSYREGIRFDKINDEASYISICAYGQSKVAKILHASELAKRFKEENIGITANSVHPGIIASNVLRYRRKLHALQTTVGKLFLENVQTGAAASCFVALHPKVKGVSGKYFNRYKMTTPSEKATDMDLAKKLWDFSMDLVS